VKPAMPSDIWARVIANPPKLTIDSGVEESGKSSIIPVTQAHQLHTMAAMCLYGQEFGFTQDRLIDLKEIREACGNMIVHFSDGMNSDAVSRWTIFFDTLNWHIDRIEALLPPH
jgi:hypothetical protein